MTNRVQFGGCVLRERPCSDTGAVVTPDSDIHSSFPWVRHMLLPDAMRCPDRRPRSQVLPPTVTAKFVSGGGVSTAAMNEPRKSFGAMLTKFPKMRGLQVDPASQAPTINLHIVPDAPLPWLTGPTLKDTRIYGDELLQ